MERKLAVETLAGSWFHYVYNYRTINFVEFSPCDDPISVILFIVSEGHGPMQRIKNLSLARDLRFSKATPPSMCYLAAADVSHVIGVCYGTPSRPNVQNMSIRP